MLPFLIHKDHNSEQLKREQIDDDLVKIMFSKLEKLSEDKGLLDESISTLVFNINMKLNLKLSTHQQNFTETTWTQRELNFGNT